MKKFVISILILLLGSSNALMADTPETSARVSQTRKVAAFRSIEITSAAEVWFTQADECTLRIEGAEDNVSNIRSTVDAQGKLVLGFVKEKRTKEGVEIYLTAPSLDAIEFTGVGSVHLDQPVRFEDFRFALQGVGKAYIHDIHCKRLDVHVQGVGKANIRMECRELKATLNGIGSISLSGQTDYASIQRDGIGSVDTNRLNIKYARKN